jgi:hypothetical protein
VSDDGAMVKGRYVHPVGGNIDEWHLRAVRE